MAVKTKTQILNTAEALFAQQGFSNTSLRTITTCADVNLASVNYHFGSKKLLIQAVLQRYLDVLMPKVNQQLDHLVESVAEPEVPHIFEAMVEPLLSLNNLRPNGTSTFVLLLGRGYSESQGHLRRFITEHYGPVLMRVVAMVHQALPELAPSEVFWRLHFAIGTFVFSMASSSALTEIAAADYDQDVDIKGVIGRILPFISAGVATPLQTGNWSLDLKRDIA